MAEKKTIKKIAILLLLWIFFPLVWCAAVFGYTVTWAFYLLSGRTDAPPGQPLAPLSPRRVIKVTWYVLTYLYENLTGPFIPSIIQYCWHKLSTERKRTSVRTNIRYGQRLRNRLDVYLPDRVSTTVLKNSKGFTEGMINPTMATHIPISNSNQSECPVIILICASWNSGNKATCLPVACNLQSQGYVVVVPDITLYPRGKIAEMVSDVQEVIFWTHTNIRHYRGDPSQIYLMGHSAGALISALTVIHDACASLNVLPPNNTSVRIPVWDNTRRTSLPRVAGLILFSGAYDITYYYAYLHHKGIEQVHALPRVMGNTPESFLQCSPTYLLNAALTGVKNRDHLKMHLPRKILLIHGAKDSFNPPSSTRNFFDLLVSVGIPSVQLKIYEHQKHISPRIDLIVPTKRLCVLLLEDIKDCCMGHEGVVMMGGQLREKREESDQEVDADEAANVPLNRSLMVVA